MEEATRNLIGKFKMDPAKARSRQEDVHRHFPEAWVKGFEPLIDVMSNDPKDRHVLAAAARCFGAYRRTRRASSGISAKNKASAYRANKQSHRNDGGYGGTHE
jgi:hypothetical protein